MANMSYCRFRNTLPDLHDCYDNWDEASTESDEEAHARQQLLKLCIQIVRDFGPAQLEIPLAEARKLAQGQ
mgnify:CR=1 FL=1